MKEFTALNFGFSDAENYRRRENKDMFNRIFVKNRYLDELCDQSKTFLVGEKGTGKTAYAVYLSNNNYNDTYGALKYIRETDYKKFLTLKQTKSLDLSDYTNIWKVIIYLLISQEIKRREKTNFPLAKFSALNEINKAVEEYYANAFSPEILSALEFVKDSKLAAELLCKYVSLSGSKRKSTTFTESRFQINLLYIQKQFEEALAKAKLSSSHILFIDGIDIRPGSIPYHEYLECIKGLANAVWEVNNDFFPSIRDSKGRMRAILLVRPDIFESLALQNQNTKLKDNSIFLDWRTEYLNHRSSELFRVIDRLLAVQQGGDPEYGSAWDHYFNFDAPNIRDEYTHPTSFISFLRYAYYRPRDIVTMLSIMQKGFIESGAERDVTSIADFEDPAFQRKYSNYLLGEVKDQLLFYHTTEEYNLFIKFFEFLMGKDKFTYDEFVKAFVKTKKYIHDSGKEDPKFMSSAEDFLQFLFTLNVICYLDQPVDSQRKFIHWCFRDRSYANISPKVKLNVEYQIFYGLSKALNLGKHFTK